MAEAGIALSKVYLEPPQSTSSNNMFATGTGNWKDVNIAKTEPLDDILTFG